MHSFAAAQKDAKDITDRDGDRTYSERKQHCGNGCNGGSGTAGKDLQSMAKGEMSWKELEPQHHRVALRRRAVELRR